jgi:lysophospholipid acyltransferase (LPLAT)-like uncharacterized protein
LKSFFKYFFGLASVQYALSFIIYLYLQLVYHTSKKQIIFEKGFDLKRYNTESAIYAFWHNRMAMMPFDKPKKIKINVLISDHRDGRIIAQTMKVFGFDIISGSSTKNSYSAIKNILKQSNLGQTVAITPDGPKGPKKQINSNIIAISGLCQKYIIPMTYSCSKAFILRSWDRLIIPKLFNKIVIVLGTPIKPEKKLSDEQIKKLNNQLVSSLNYINDKADSITKLKENANVTDI